ncbi:ABC transporter permease [Microbacterium murale]|uniref:Peptide/nickel transport system permease protein n=1 Tax=Microbacterium murale TaxID=1081040 RepID=A0ABU0PBI2_9MICO|nr:ABC transporter permease [Microbacterium murale]MDQ0644700.1 peptide/nickel transport system permease protein [Microbacterium murale]
MSVVLWSIRRIAAALVTLIAVSVLIFASVRLMPGDYIDLVLGPLATEAQRAQAVADSGLDAPVMEQYFRWVFGVVTGDLGYSFVSNVSVSEEFAARLPVTATIALLTIIVTLLIGIPLGFLAALRSEGSAGAAGRLVSALGISLPEFLLAGLVVFVVSTLGLGLSVGQFAAFSTDPGRFFGSLVLPVVVLSIGCVAVVARNTRDAVMNVLVEPHVQAAVARGETPGFIVRHHVLRNAAAPILTIVGALVAVLLGGTVIVEFVFNIPGMGSYLQTALGRRDYSIVQSAVLLAAMVFIVASLIVDLVANALDPRLRLTGGSSR